MGLILLEPSLPQRILFAGMSLLELHVTFGYLSSKNRLERFAIAATTSKQDFNSLTFPFVG